MIITIIASPTLEMLQDAMVMVHTNATIELKHAVSLKSYWRRILLCILYFFKFYDINLSFSI